MGESDLSSAQSSYKQCVCFFFRAFGGGGGGGGEEFSPLSFEFPP